ncbi:MAG TPA: LysM peptidoglycan-binding domain-containing protein [Nitrospiraceae bacterium]|nr:LysM peptidoglycan-binding domain-containing protein [Nitrospiraceae bacterium]
MKQGVQHRIFRTAARVSMLVMGALVATGCVMSEKYEAEKARSLNFQRLLAQEEKRTAELDSEVKRAKRELSEMEARNRELGAQVEAVRQQAAQIQEEAEAMKEAALLERKAREDMKRMTTPAKPKKRERPEPLDMPKSEPDSFDDRPGSMAAEKGFGVPDMPNDMPTTLSAESLHTVQPGETLFRIGRKYHVSVDKLRKWNNLQDDTIEVGQKLIIAQP